MKPMPVCAMQSAICAGLSARLMPSDSTASALPDLLLTLRPPCLLTLAPAAAITNMAQVEMLKVWAPSPPVPTMSTRCALSATSTLTGELAHDLGRGGDLADGLPSWCAGRR